MKLAAAASVRSPIRRSAWLPVSVFVYAMACGGTDAGEDANAGDAGRASDAATEPTTVRVLFIGNSYTSVNDLPGAVARLAEAPESAMRFEVAQHTPGGQTWEGHDADPAVDALIREGWDYVVLQDQSQQPWWGPPSDVKPALRSLDAKIRAASARTVLYMTWAREDGPFHQDMLVDSYYESAGEAVGARVAPVGRAWERALRDPAMVLHADDGSHPNARGTYLAACVIYATLAERSPMGLGDGGLPLTLDERAALQRIAWEAITARARPTPPLLGQWPLSSATSGNDLVPSDDLTLGDTTRRDGSPSSATTFSLDAYAAVPYFAGINTGELTVSVDAYRADWSRPTERREYLVSRGMSYDITLEGTVLTASVFLPPADGIASTPATPRIPVPPDPVPPTTDITFASNKLAAGWHRITLTHGSDLDTLWIDRELVASKPSGGIACSHAGPGCTGGIALGVQSEATTSLLDVTRLPFTGALADLQLHGAVLTAEQIQNL